MNPVIDEALYSNNEVKICLTSQHDIRSLLVSVNDSDIISLDLKRDERGLCGLTGNILRLLDGEKSLEDWNPDMVVVHGDTTSALCGALYAFYKQIKLCHVESGLRSDNKFSPFPEEANRKLIDYLSDIHFAPHQNNKERLEKERVGGQIHVVGNTIVDVVKKNVVFDFNSRLLDWAGADFVLVTLHRRENWGENIKGMLSDISDFARTNKYKIVYVKNQNPALQKMADEAFIDNDRVLVSDPLSTFEFHNVLARCSFVMTDSGGIQEEANFLGKPIMVLRNETERQEILDCGGSVLVPPERLRAAIKDFLIAEFNKCPSLYGNGDSSRKIIEIINDENRI